MLLQLYIDRGKSRWPPKQNVGRYASEAKVKLSLRCANPTKNFFVENSTEGLCTVVIT